MEGLNNNTIIKNIGTDQKKILYDIITLYNEGKGFECDMTASELKFYDADVSEPKEVSVLNKKGEKVKNIYKIPVPNILFDTYPLNDNIKKIMPFEKLPLEDNSISSIVVDLPFVISPKTAKSVIEKKTGSNIISSRFASWYPYMEAYENMFWWIRECFRVLKEDGICVWKMQNTVSGSINHSFTEFAFICGQDAGFYVIDNFTLQAKARLISSGKYNKQCHARKFTSNFLVFKKGDKFAEKSNCLAILKHCKETELEYKVWELK